jgi:heme-degrading monooxygenase HmoA
MITKVIIKRKLIPGKEREFLSLLRQLRLTAMEQEGYISGETLICTEQTNKILVISKWASLDHWKTWKKHRKRKVIDDLLNELQEEPTIYEPYVFSKYRVGAELCFPLPLQDQECL